MPPRLIVTDTLTADGLRGVDNAQGFAERSADEAVETGNEREASFWRRIADRWHGKRLDLMAG
ncbi:hypothetical protein FZ983_17140 [Azospirillum sp. B21]|uniref:hypothetical protein n=1 Tax=Azospirillum sp. B21 TaxID=2607496 RepID=UPI0011EFCB72|nr:hypothetical protein [Azospirillum sp. B21]KAA0579048.1 hypothetical protein FZ983_17140 [Azospirillum sp. B21]